MEYHHVPSSLPLFGTSFETLRDTLEPYHHSLSRPAHQTDAPFQWSMDIAAANGLTIVQAQCSDEWSLTHEGGEENLGLLMPHAGRLEVTLDKQDVSAIPGQAMLVPTPLLRYMRFCCDEGKHVLVSLNFAKSVIARVLPSLAVGAELHELHLEPLIDLSKGIGPTLNLLVQTLMTGMYGDKTLERSPKTMARLIDSALHLIFENVPHRSNDRATGRLPNITPRHVKIATDFMHANLHRQLTVAEIAKAAAVSVRALQAGFQRYRDTTPLRYLRTIRLEAVHAELSSPDNRLSVGEVAQKWGFGHFGRFSAQYRAIYGQYPSETVKQTWRSLKEKDTDIHVGHDVSAK